MAVKLVWGQDWQPPTGTVPPATIVNQGRTQTPPWTEGPQETLVPRVTTARRGQAPLWPALQAPTWTPPGTPTVSIAQQAFSAFRERWTLWGAPEEDTALGILQLISPHVLQAPTTQIMVGISKPWSDTQVWHFGGELRRISDNIFAFWFVWSYHLISA